MEHKPNIYQANRCPPCPPNSSLTDIVTYWLGVGLGSGKPRRAAGTWGTLGGVIVGLAMFFLGFWGFLIITLLGCLVGNHICGKTSQLMGIEDDPHIVFDEWVGVWIALLPLAWQTKQINLTDLDFWIGLGLAFGLFRLFDVLKPPPISWADKQVSGGFGIMLDDILAGVMAALAWFLCLYLYT